MPHLTLADDRIAVTVDAATGGVRALEHTKAGLHLIADPDQGARHPFAVILRDGSLLRSFETCSVEPGW